MGKLTIRKIPCYGWENCIEISNGIVDIVVTTDIGPRVIRYGFNDDRNELNVWTDQSGMTGGDEWRCYGGSRLWHGPEIGTRCYEPDNDPVQWEENNNGITLYQNTESWTKMTKQTKIIMDTDTTEVHFNYSIKNDSPWTTDICIWVLTLLDAGGTQIIPRTPFIPNMRPNSVMPTGAIAYWPYTNLGDSRFQLSERYILLNQDPDIAQPFKIGLPVEDGWVAYVNAGHMYVKKFPYLHGARYPDYHSSYETYVNAEYMEIESLSPMHILEPGDIITHKETWQLFRDVPCPKNDNIDRDILPLIKNK